MTTRKAQAEIDGTKAPASDKILFARPAAAMSHACLVCRYDAAHPTRQPGAECQRDEAPGDLRQRKNHQLLVSTWHSFLHRVGNFDAAGYCGRTVAQEAGNEIRLRCGVDCDGGGINVALSKRGKSAIIRLERIPIRDRDKADEEADEASPGGADDRIFRVDRGAGPECAELVTDGNLLHSGPSDRQVAEPTERANRTGPAE